MSSSSPFQSWPTLNWKEIQFLCKELTPLLAGRTIEKLIIPQRNWLAPSTHTFNKNEWAIRLSNNSGTLLFGFRQNFPYFAYTQASKIQSHTQATRSPFDLAVSKHIDGNRIQKLEAFDQERIFALWLESKNQSQLGLIFSFIPNHPEILLIEKNNRGKLLILSSSTLSKDSKKKKDFFTITKNPNPPQQIQIRQSLKSSFEIFYQEIEKNIELSHFYEILSKTEKKLAASKKNIETKLKQTEKSLEHLKAIPPWEQYGHLLKAHLHSLPKKIKTQFLELDDYKSEKKIKIPYDVKLSPSEQLKKFYDLAKKHEGTLEETQNQFKFFKKKIADLNALFLPSFQSLDWKKLDEVKNLLPREKSETSQVRSQWPGRSFISVDQFAIHVGRNKKENLEITFKHARGNDLWMHVKGKPGAHVIIPLPSGKSAPLETLLDAATLTIYYSDGKNWGKTEVDYTYKKYIKRIKNSDEVSYTQNKTLLVTIEEDRLQRLLSEAK